MHARARTRTQVLLQAPVIEVAVNGTVELRVSKNVYTGRLTVSGGPDEAHDSLPFEYVATVAQVRAQGAHAMWVGPGPRPSSPMICVRAWPVWVRVRARERGQVFACLAICVQRGRLLDCAQSRPCVYEVWNFRG